MGISDRPRFVVAVSEVQSKFVSRIVRCSHMLLSAWRIVRKSISVSVVRQRIFVFLNCRVVKVVFVQVRAAPRQERVGSQAPLPAGPVHHISGSYRTDAADADGVEQVDEVAHAVVGLVLLRHVFTNRKGAHGGVVEDVMMGLESYQMEKRAKLPDSKIRFFSQIFLQKGVSQYHLIPFLLMAMVLMMN